MLEAGSLFVFLAGFQFTAALCLAFLVCWLKVPCTETSRSGWYWILAFFLGGAGTILIGYRGVLPDSLTLVLANALILFGSGLRASAVATFFKQPGRLRIAIAVASGWLLMCTISEFRNTLVLRADYTQTAMAALMFWGGWIAMRKNCESLVSPAAYWAAALIEGLAYVGILIHYNSFGYTSFLASLGSYVLPFSMLIILLAMMVSTCSIFVMFAERSFLMRRGFHGRRGPAAQTGHRI